MKILAGYDDSSCSEAALDDLQRAGLPTKVEALVLSVTEASIPPPPPSSLEILEQARVANVPAETTCVLVESSPAIDQAQAIAERAATRLRAIFPHWTVSSEASVGSPWHEIVKKADSWQPDLIVVGSHGRTGVTQLVLGSVSRALLTYAHCSVRVARGRVDEPDSPVGIIIGVDGSPASAAAVREVASRHWPAGSEVRVIAVAQPWTPTLIGRLIPPVVKTIEESNQADREWLKRIVDNARRELQGSKLRVFSEIREGQPKDVLLEAARQWGADCIFVGSIGFGNPLERFVLGSVSASVAARAHCSVEVVRPRDVRGGKYEHSRN